MNETRSTAYAPASPTVAMRIPPIAGPTIEAIWKLSWLSAMADGSRSGGTSRGIADDRVGWSTARQAGRHERDREQRRDAAGRRSAPAGRARGCRPPARPGSTISSRRRSTASASDPGPEREEQDRDQLEERQRRDREGRAGQDVDLVRQRDPGDLVADAVDDLAGPQPAVVAVAAERRGVEEEAADARSPGCGAVRRPRWVRRSGAESIRRGRVPCDANSVVGSSPVDLDAGLASGGSGDAELPARRTTSRRAPRIARATGRPAGRRAPRSRRCRPARRRTGSTA